MKKAIILVLFFVLILAVGVKATDYDKEIDQWFYNQESFILEDKVFEIYFDEDNEEIMVRQDYDFYMLELGDCEEESNVKICYTEIGYDTTKKEKKFRLVIYRLIREIKITRTINASSFFVGQTAKIKVKLENIGGRKISNITYIDDFGSSINITDTDDCDKNGTIIMWKNETTIDWKEGNNVFWTGAIDAGDYEEFEYELTPLEVIDTDFKARLTYFDGFKTVEDTSGALRINAKSMVDIETAVVEDPFKINSGGSVDSESDDEIYLGEDRIFVLYLDNEYGENIDINYIDVRLGTGLEYVGPAGIWVRINSSSSKYVGFASFNEIEPGVFRWRGDLPKNGKYLAFKFKGVLRNEDGISVVAEFENDDGFKEMKSERRELEVKHTELIARANFEDNDEFDVTQRKLLNIYIQNPNDYADYKNLVISFNTTLGNFSNVYMNKLEGMQYRDVFNQEIDFSKFNTSQRHFFNARIDYETEFGENYTTKFYRKIKIVPIAPIRINQKIDDRTLEGDEKTTVEVELENTGNQDAYGINATDIFDKRLNAMGEISRRVDINKGVKLSVYVYEIKAPRVGIETKFNITTMLSYYVGQETLNTSKTTTITVQPKKLDITINKEISNSEIFRGENAYVDYTLTNPNEETIYNVELNFPVQKDFDLIGSDKYVVSKIFPDDSVFISKKEMIRAQKDGKLKITPTLIKFEDEFGNVFYKNSTQLTPDVKKSAISGPIITIDKNTSRDEINSSDEIDVGLKITNLGNVKTDVLVLDNNKEWLMQISPGTTKSLSYKMNFQNIGKITLPAARAEYQEGETIYRTASNQKQINVLNATTALASKQEEKTSAEISPEKEEIREEGETVSAEKRETLINMKTVSIALIILVAFALIAVYIKSKGPKRKFEFLEE